MTEDIGIRLSLIDEASKQLSEAQKKIMGALGKMSGDSLLNSRIMGAAFIRYGKAATDWADSMVDAYASVDQATAAHLEAIDGRMNQAKANMGEAMAPAILAMKGAAAGLAESLSRLPKPLLQAAGGMAYVGGMAMQAGGQIIQMATNMFKLMEMGVLTKGSMINLGLAMGATLLIVGALTTDSDALRAAMAGLAAILVVYTIRKWVQNAADMVGLSIWTMGVGVAIALGAAIFGITAAMHASQKAQQEATEANMDFQDSLDGTSTSMGNLASNTNVTNFLLETGYTDTLLSIGGMTTMTWGQIWEITSTAQDKIALKITDQMGNISTITATAMEGMTGVYKDEYGNMYKITQDELGRIMLKVVDEQGNAVTVVSDSMVAVEDFWNGTWSAIGRDDKGVLANVVVSLQTISDSMSDVADSWAAAAGDMGDYTDLLNQKNKGLLATYMSMETWLGPKGKAIDNVAKLVYAGGKQVWDTGSTIIDALNPFDDVIWRPGQNPIAISPDDTVIAYKGNTPPGTSGGGIYIGHITINASSYEGGQQAATGLRNELLRRGVQFTR